MFSYKPTLGCSFVSQSKQFWWERLSLGAGEFFLYNLNFSLKAQINGVRTMTLFIMTKFALLRIVFSVCVCAYVTLYLWNWEVNLRKENLLTFFRWVPGIESYTILSEVVLSIFPSFNCRLVAANSILARI